MTKYKKAFLDYYGNHKISPVSQDISDLKTHYARREALYRHLGIVPSFLKGKSVLEFGPGSGHNALYTASLSPRRYVLVDGNPTGLEDTEKRLNHFEVDIEVVNSWIEDFESDQRFDMVMCEGVLPWQNEPQNMLKHVAKFVAPGGVLLISCNNEISQLSEFLRKLQALLMVDRNAPLMKRAEVLKTIFQADAASLDGMSRPIEDWIIDQILQPFVGECLSIGQSIITLDDTFDIYSTSPHFLTDWSWYKAIPIRKESFNQVGLRSFNENIHNLLDYRFSFPPRCAEDNTRLDDIASRMLNSILGYEDNANDDILNAICDDLDLLVKEVERFSPPTAESLRDFAHGLKQYEQTGTFPILTAFAPLFGRGQQYASFIRK